MVLDPWGGSDPAAVLVRFGVELGQLMFVFVVLLFLTLLRYAAGVTRESRTFIAGERIAVYTIGILASYWLIERSAGIFPVTV